MAFITTMPAPPMHHMQSFLEDMRKDAAKKTAKAAKTLKYPGVIISHGETIEEVPTFPPPPKTLKYPGVIISHGETIEEVPTFPPPPKTTWSRFKDCFAGPSPFAGMPTS